MVFIMLHRRVKTHFSHENEGIVHVVYLFTTPIIPSLTGMTLPIRTSMASVPASIRSSLVTTARVLLPDGGEHIQNTTGHTQSLVDTQAEETPAGSPTINVSLSRYFQGLRGCHVCVGCSHSQDDGIWVGDVLKDQLPDLDLDIFGLISHWNLLEQK